jgi:hypothetical protein
MASWPAWWEWELELSPHLFKRMLDRGFTELDLRRMLDVATGLDPDVLAGRWRVATRLRSEPWEIIVEPDPDTERMIVVTAYPLDS